MSAYSSSLMDRAKTPAPDRQPALRPQPRPASAVRAVQPPEAPPTTVLPASAQPLPPGPAEQELLENQIRLPSRPDPLRSIDRPGRPRERPEADRAKASLVPDVPAEIERVGSIVSVRRSDTRLAAPRREIDAPDETAPTWLRSPQAERVRLPRPEALPSEMALAEAEQKEIHRAISPPQRITEDAGAVEAEAGSLRPRPSSAGSQPPAAREARSAVQTEPAVPTVHVHIGRVEVRAALPPGSGRPQPSAPQRASPEAALADYLQKRWRGER